MIERLIANILEGETRVGRKSLGRFGIDSPVNKEDWNHAMLN